MAQKFLWSVFDLNREFSGNKNFRAKWPQNFTFFQNSPFFKSSHFFQKSTFFKNLFFLLEIHIFGSKKFRWFFDLNQQFFGNKNFRAKWPWMIPHQIEPSYYLLNNFLLFLLLLLLLLFGKLLFPKNRPKCYKNVIVSANNTVTYGISDILITWCISE